MSPNLELVVSNLIGLGIDVGYNHTQVFLEDTCLDTVKEDDSVDQIREKIISGCSWLKKANERVLEHLEAEVIKPQWCLQSVSVILKKSNGFDMLSPKEIEESVEGEALDKLLEDLDLVDELLDINISIQQPWNTTT